MPPARTNPQIAYDSKTATLLLFGGFGFYGDLNDTWVWNGTTWIQQHPAISPPSSFSIEGNALSLSGTSMTYNNATHQIVLMLSASDNDSGDHKTQLSWTWDGKTWTRQAIQNPGADQAILTYDAAQQTILEFSDTLPHNGNFIDKLCKWTDQGWQELATWS
jgi:hypothetical protein